MLVVSSILVGHAYLDALRFYAEASGSGGGPAALAQSLSPLDGIVVPVFGPFDLVATLVFPFVVIRLFAIERETGELAISLQSRFPFSSATLAKVAALYLMWIVALLPGCVALLHWKMSGGHLAAPETFVVIAGHLVRGFLTIGIGAVSCAVTASSSSAAIIALTITLGTWMLDYLAAAQGGIVSVISRYTPEAALRVFERGELDIGIATIVKIIALLFVVLWAIASQVGRSRRWRTQAAAILVVIAGLLSYAARHLHADRDLSEDRRNSFSRSEERVLARLQQPLRVTIFLAAEDPRLVDFERGVLYKLRRTVPHLEVQYAARSRSGLFESGNPNYGEIHFTSGGRAMVTRSVAEPVVLESLNELLQVKPAPDEERTYSGYPARIDPTLVPWLFFLVIPVAIVLVWRWQYSRRSDLSPVTQQ
jgi:hypothetical protein